MKKILCAIIALFITFMYTGVGAFAIQQVPGARTLQAKPNARSVEFAFVFDGPSDKNATVLKTFQQTITRSLLPDYKAVFPAELVFTGDWTEQGARVYYRPRPQDSFRNEKNKQLLVHCYLITKQYSLLS